MEVDEMRAVIGLDSPKTVISRKPVVLVRFEAFPPAEARQAVKSAGFRWEPDWRAWWTTANKLGVDGAREVVGALRDAGITVALSPETRDAARGVQTVPSGI